MTKSMKDLEKATDIRYENVRMARGRLAMEEGRAHTLSNRLIYGPLLLVAFLIFLLVVTSWLFAVLPAVSGTVLTVMALRRLYWLRTVELPAHRAEVRNCLEEATDALQAQEDRRVLGLLKPEEYATLEEKAAQELEQRRAEKEKKRKRQEELEYEAMFKESMYRSYSIRW